MFSGILANRIKGILQQIVHEDQKGFVNYRCIGKNIRLIYDLMLECDVQKLKGIHVLVLVDFEKAFDTLDCKLLNKVLEYSNLETKF